MPRRYPKWDVGAAQALASFAHHGQRDKAGFAYINHPAMVGQFALGILIGKSTRGGHQDLDMGVVHQVAWLHDVLEDTLVTSQMLLDLGCPNQVWEAVTILTRHPDVPDDLYYENIRHHPVARVVKQADIADNCSPGRLARLDEQTRERLLEKYRHASAALSLPFPYAKRYAEQATTISERINYEGDTL